MNPQEILTQAKTKFTAAVSHFQEDLKKLRTGRAHPSMLDGLMVEAYGQPMPLISVATTSAPEPQLLQITPFDPSTLQAIASAIRDNQSLGLNPVDDGKVVRINIPPLTTERRQQIAKQLNDKTEDCMIALRNARHEAIKAAEAVKKSAGESEFDRLQKQIDELMSKQKTEVDSLAKTKEAEIMKV